MSGKDNETTALAPISQPSVAISSLAPLNTIQGAADVGSGKLSHGSLNHMVKTAGGETDFEGGSLPPIRFQNEGDAFLLEFLGREEPDEKEGGKRDFCLLQFYVLDAKAYIVEAKAVSDCRLYKGSIGETWAFEKVYSAGNEKNMIGKVRKVTFVGKAQKKDSDSTRNAAFLFSIEALRIPARDKVDSVVMVESAATKGKKK